MTNLAKRFLEELKEVPDILYHGSPSQITSWSTEYTGKGDDQYGPGIYFTSNYEDALGYARKGEDGQVYTVRLASDKQLDAAAPPNKEEIRSFITWADDYENTLENFDSNPRIALKMAIEVYMEEETAFDAFQFIGRDFYRNDGQGYCSSMTALDYDFVVIDRDFMNTKHVVVWNPKIIKGA